MKEIEYKSCPSPEYLAELLKDIRERLIRIEDAIGTSHPGFQDFPSVLEKHNYVYGIKGIMRLFNVSNVTAQRYKNGIIREAVKQNGRIIVTDVDLALKLFNERKEAAFIKLTNE